MSEISNEKDDFSESKLVTDLDDSIEFDIHNDESIDDESPEVGWNSEDEKKYYSKTINMDAIEEEKSDELNEAVEEKKEEIDELINKEKEINTNTIEEEDKTIHESNDNEINKNKSGLLGFLYRHVCELFDNLGKPFSK